MGEFKQYRRKQITELRPWAEGDDMERVSVSAPDKEAGSPKPGDMVARNPKNHDDQWLVAAQYFADNFEPIDPPTEAMKDALVHGTGYLHHDADGSIEYVDLRDVRAKAEGGWSPWHKWSGGECPVTDGVWFEFKDRSGFEGGPHDNATHWMWGHNQCSGDIIAYRTWDGPGEPG
jgi:hypothetical protein